MNRTLRSIVLLAILSIFFSSCSYKVTSTVYKDVPKKELDNKIVFVNDTTQLVSASTIAKIKLEDSGFTLANKCTEQKAVEILISEAKGLNANIIYIEKQKLPDSWSTCYRCSATFLYTDSISEKEQLFSELYYSQLQIEKRDQEQKRIRKTNRQWGFSLGVAIGLIVIFIY